MKMKNFYRVRPEFWDKWAFGMSDDEIANTKVSAKEIYWLAREWGISVEELMEQVEKI